MSLKVFPYFEWTTVSDMENEYHSAFLSPGYGYVLWSQYKFVVRQINPNIFLSKFPSTDKGKK